MASVAPSGDPEEQYNSASDDDFNPDAPVDGSEGGESSDDEATANTITQNGARRPVKRKVRSAAGVEDADFDNSGDESTIRKASRKSKKRRADLSRGGDDQESAGEGGLIKTRAQRRAEAIEKKPLVQAGNSTVDVEALWARMAREDTKKTEVDRSTAQVELLPTNAVANTSSVPAHCSNQISSSDHKPPTGENKTNSPTQKAAEADLPVPTITLPTGDGTIMIKRTYEFAGGTVTEERFVPDTSAEARLYLQQQAQGLTTSSQPSHPVQKPTSQSSNTAKPPLRRPKKRASMFGTDSASTGGGDAAAKGPKLTTLEKSKLDWAQYVDQEGMGEELDEAGKAKSGYLGRMDFLGRMDARREEEVKKAKGSGK